MKLGLLALGLAFFGCGDFQEYLVEAVEPATLAVAQSCALEVGGPHPEIFSKIKITFLPVLHGPCTGADSCLYDKTMYITQTSGEYACQQVCHEYVHAISYEETQDYDYQHVNHLWSEIFNICHIV